MKQERGEEVQKLFKSTLKIAKCPLQLTFGFLFHFFQRMLTRSVSPCIQASSVPSCSLSEADDAGTRWAG